MFTTDPFRSSNLADAVCKKYKIHRYTVYQLSLVLFWHSPVKTRWWEARRESERERERRNSEQTYARTKEGLKGHGRKKTTICVVFSVFGRMHLARELLQNNSYQTPFTVHRPPSTSTANQSQQRINLKGPLLNLDRPRSQPSNYPTIK